MKRKGSLYGWMGCLSLLGLIGIFSEEKLFLTFFAFAVDFEYFFMRSDEMLEEYMNRSAARASGSPQMASRQDSAISRTGFFCSSMGISLLSP